MNWHTPSITPAEGAVAIGFVLLINFTIWVVRAMLMYREPVKPDTEDEVVGDVPHIPRGGL